ncbi:efflux RND transporter periplasmic adaptor subunit [Mucilaginibacter limnophilus]|uniref:Efflux RND transporter periplasmic adaptor subunit n=1 Tax=Mucilaginibacter limnophilus TaxID=1932778 RepID=A0A3S2Y0X2_9SPHI|nr:efflux RND transporter periplasmic adaptor subunit [Mucilaginibacter limnophilus]RVT97368.1 efflux RND transporter periplasmic adaptor subunit [Mucilaginibacter limnophilus]
MEKFKAICYVAACALLLLVTGCSSSTNKEDKEAADTLQMPVITLKTCDTVLQKAYVADIQALKNVEIRARVKGFLEKIYVDEGKYVKKGQPLFKIDDREYKVMLSKAKAALSNAIADAKAIELETDRVRMLVDKKVISKSELDVELSKLNASKATIDEARSMVQSAENLLEFAYIKSPFAGIIDRIPLKAGSLIDEGTLLTSISDNSSMYAYFSFPENEYLNYVRTMKTSPDKTSQKVSLVLADGLEFPERGDIETVEGEIEQTTGSINFRARFPNPQGLLRHGATGKLYLSTKAKAVVMIPQQSVFDIQDKSYVYIVDKNNKLHMQAFTPLTRISNYYIVKEGLKAGDKILFEGTQNARDGMVIKPKLLAKDTLLAMH